MKKKVRSTSKLLYKEYVPRGQFDSTEFLLLAFMIVSLMVFFAWQTGILPQVGTMVLGVSSAR